MTPALTKVISEDNRSKVFEQGKRKLNAIKTDPYGFWHVEEDGKRLNDIGVFTSMEDLDDGINAYLNTPK